MGLLVEPPAASVPTAALCSAPAATPKPAAAQDGRVYVVYDELHKAIANSLAQLQKAGWDAPDYLLAISGGGLIPARILRSVLRRGTKQGGCAAIKVIGLELYNDELDGRPSDAGVRRTQWLEPGSTSLAGRHILVVDEVDDSRATLEYAVRELKADVAAEEAAAAAAGLPPPGPTHLGVFMLHCKQREKVGRLPEDVPQFVAQEVEGNPWLVYPWDAPDIEEHNQLASQGRQ
ncbi:hypothetical protein ABPG75_011627 [Micractinium tetrahymenae]